VRIELIAPDQAELNSQKEIRRGESTFAAEIARVQDDANDQQPIKEYSHNMMNKNNGNAKRVEYSCEAEV
jgi:hypothetical protein